MENKIQTIEITGYGPEDVEYKKKFTIRMLDEPDAKGALGHNVYEALKHATLVSISMK